MTMGKTWFARLSLSNVRLHQWTPGWTEIDGAIIRSTVIPESVPIFPGLVSVKTETHERGGSTILIFSHAAEPELSRPKDS